ncbi:MAG: DUF91 domain-containing protein [Acidobacteria bacterium]|nr:DUF91 domain-containing protein [Acidobacteriota bacterium]
MGFQRDFSLPASYEFLKQNGLETECNAIRDSPDVFKSYTSTLRRAKVSELVQQKNLMDSFCQSVWEFGASDKGAARIRFYANLLTRFRASEEGNPLPEDDEEEVHESDEFAYESDLQSYLIKNLSAIEPGLTLYKSGDGKSGVEFYVPGTSRRIDILAVDTSGTLVVVELKVSRGYERVVGQTLYYQSKLKKYFSAERVRAVIVAREITEELRDATMYLPDFQLFEYQMSVSLKPVEREI